jgi:menaquinone-9 beta-reductase
VTAPRANQEAWDVVVVGAGPAGSAAALAALRCDPGLSVLLLDRADFPRDKCCGDGIAPQVLDVLASVGAGDVTDGWEPVHRLVLARGARSIDGILARPALVVPRSVFDARLVERAVAAGAVLWRRRVESVRSTPARVVVDEMLRARVVIGADGAHSVVRSALGCRAHPVRALALRGYAPTPEHRRTRQVIRFGDRHQPSYAWAFDRGDGLSNVGYGELVPAGRGRGPTRSVMLEQLDRLLPGAADGGDHWRGHHLPLSGWRWHQPDGPVLLVGDAAGLVNPLSGEGIYYAVATGVLAGRSAARTIAGGAPEAAGSAHRLAVRRLLGRHLKHTWVVSRLARRPAVLDAGLAAAGASPRVFDDLVEIGLGDGRVTPRLGAGLAAALISTLAHR